MFGFSVFSVFVSFSNFYVRLGFLCVYDVCLFVCLFLFLMCFVIVLCATSFFVVLSLFSPSFSICPGDSKF